MCSMKFSLLFFFTICSAFIGFSQVSRRWTENDRRYLLDNLERTKQEVISATSSLNAAQWSFREDSTRWSIAQVIEHLGLAERIFMQEAGILLMAPPDTSLKQFLMHDSIYINKQNDPSPNHASWNVEPLGLMNGADNLTFFVFGRDHMMIFVRETQNDLKVHFTYRAAPEQRRSIHALMVTCFAHTDRHLKQISKIKQAPNFPK